MIALRKMMGFRMLILAALLTIAIGIIHSVLGERYILIRLFRQPLPKLFDSDEFTRKTLRFAWHITTLAWFGFAALLIQIYLGRGTTSALLMTIAATFAITALVALIASRGKHLSWIVFGAIATLCYYAA